MTGPWLGPARPNLTASVPAAHARPTRFPPREEPKARPTAAAQTVSQPAATRSAQTSAGVRACLESAAPAGCPPRPGEVHGPGLRQHLDVVGLERASGLGELALETGEGMQFCVYPVGYKSNVSPRIKLPSIYSRLEPPNP
jgi:hypothetical protein